MVTRGKDIAVLAYAAGIIDGEASFAIRRVRPSGLAKSLVYQASVDVGSTEFTLIEWLIQNFGGSYYSMKPTQAHYRPVRRWNLSAVLAADFSEQVLPYLIVKRQQATLLIEFVRTRGSFRPKDGATGRIVKVSDAELAWRESMYQRMVALNHPQRLSEKAPDLETEGEAIV